MNNKSAKTLKFTFLYIVGLPALNKMNQYQQPSFHYDNDIYLSYCLYVPCFFNSLQTGKWIQSQGHGTSMVRSNIYIENARNQTSIASPDKVNTVAKRKTVDFFTTSLLSLSCFVNLRI